MHIYTHSDLFLFLRLIAYLSDRFMTLITAILRQGDTPAHRARVDGRATASHLHGNIEQRAVRCVTVKRFQPNRPEQSRATCSLSL